MARERTHDEILDQAVYAIEAVHRHYGSGLSIEGLEQVRKALKDINFSCDPDWQEEPDIDFYEKFLKDSYVVESFEEIAKFSKGAT